MSAFANAEGTPPFPSKDADPMWGFAEKRSTKQAREHFFAWKAQSFLTGRDPRVRYTVADHYGFEAVLPYTAANMLQFFRGLEMDFRDVFTPKRFIYRYLEELLGKSAYAALYRGQEKHVSASSLPSLTWAQWQEHVLSSTVFGRELREQANTRPYLQKERDWNPSNFQHALGMVWLQYVLSEVEGMGVSVEIS
jgi:hypothetical protein